MAEEYCGGANWWDSSPNNNRNTRFDGGRGGGGGGGGGSTTSSTTTLANSTGGAAGYGWLTDTPSTTDTKLDASSLQLMGLGLSSSPTMEWNHQHILRNPEKTENNFRSMLQEGMGLNTNFQQESGGVTMYSNPNLQWRPEKLFPNDQESTEFKQIGGRGFSLDQNPQFSPTCSSMESSVTCNNQGIQLDSSLSSSVYGSPSSILQGLIGPDQHNNQQQQQQQQQQQLNYGASNNNSSNFHQPNYFGMPQFLRASSPKQQQQQQQQQQQLQFMNNAPYWNASPSGATMNDDVRPNFFSSLQAPPQLSMPSFEEKPKTTMDIRETNSMVKKNTTQEMNTKRARTDTASSTLPPFKVRKEKMGDRITALQQLVSPFGKTDTASVLSEAIEYIKFLHEQVSVLSNPYLKSGAPYQQQQQQPNNEKGGKSDPDGPKQDLRSRGLCLVPVSSTFPVTHETTVDFWTPTFGGTFR
ncbi:transcription factor bHLH123 isoform X1 [Silene latifolia]|uniref:transcription factor bHLH123 isoform X1 n=1 Tax=Silene latifolia TaxID=37657 RepID=UPI003D77A640